MLNAILTFLFGKHKSIIVDAALAEQKVIGRNPMGEYIVVTPVTIHRVRTRFTNEAVNRYLVMKFGWSPTPASYRSYVTVSHRHGSDGIEVNTAVIRGSSVDVTEGSHKRIRRMFLDEYRFHIKPRIIG